MTSARRRIACAAAVGLLCTLCCPAVANGPSARFILLLYDGITPPDFENARLPHLRRLAREGAVALMTTPSVPGPYPERYILPLCLGFVATAQNGDLSFEGSPYPEPPRSNGAVPLDGAKQPTGHTKVEAKSITYPHSSSMRMRGLMGLLPGPWLARLDRQARAGGCADAGTQNRAAGLYAIDGAGVGYGRLPISGPDAVTRDAAAPGGLRDNIPGLVRYVQRSLSGGALVLYPGDGARATWAWSSESWAQRTAARAAALKGLDTLVGAIEQSRSAGPMTLLLVSPTPPVHAAGSLSMAVEWGDSVAGNLLTSGTTRRPGLINSTDIAPNLYAALGVQAPAQVTGRPIGFINGSTGLGAISALWVATSAAQNARLLIYLPLAAISFVALAAGLLLTRAGRTSIPVAAALLFIYNMPLAMMLVGAVTLLSARPVALAVLGLMALLVPIEFAIAAQFSRAGPLGVSEAHAEGERSLSGRYVVTPVHAAAYIVILAVIADTLTGQHLVEASLFSAYLPKGIRFYGVGNEYLGVLLGGALAVLPKPVIAGPVGRRARAVTAFGFVAIVLVLGLPSLGANAGAFIAGAAAFGCGWRVLNRQRCTVTAAVGWTCLGFGAAWIAATAEHAIVGTGSSHMGAAIGAAHTRGIAYLLQIAKRKALMNLHILSSAPALAGCIALLATGWMAFRMRAVREMMLKHPGWTLGLPALGWGSLAAWLFIDSGTVAALFMAAAYMGPGAWYLLTETQETRR